MTPQIRAIIEAIREGIRTVGLRDELEKVKARKANLAQALADAPPTAPVLQCAMAEVYCRKVAARHEALNDLTLRPASAEILRGPTEVIGLAPAGAKLDIDLAGGIAGILALAPNDKRPSGGAGGAQLTLVEGTRNHRELTLSCAI